MSLWRRPGTACCRSALAGWLLAAALAAPALRAAGPASPPAAAFEGRRIVAVDLHSAWPLAAGERFWDRVLLRPGEPYREADAAATLRELVAAGDLDDARILLAAEAAGVRVHLALWPRQRIGTVRLSGVLGLDEEDLEESLALHPGEVLVESRVERSVAALRDRLQSSGYLDATVEPVSVARGQTGLVDIDFRIAAGDPARIAALQFTGRHAAVDEAELRQLLRLQVGDAFRPGRVRFLGERLERQLAGRGYRTARVDYLGHQATDSIAEYRLSWLVELGPRIELVVEGVSREELEKRDLLPFSGNQSFDEAALLQALDRIRDEYQRRGHYHVQVSHEERRVEDVLEVRLNVEPGPVAQLVAVDFRGNASFDSGRLRQLVVVSPRRLAVPGSGRLVDADLRADLTNLRTFYSLQGYPEATVGPPELLVEQDRIHLTIPVVEGRRERVARVELSGISTLDEQELLSGLPIVAGGPYHPQHLEDALSQIRSRYEDLGHSWVQARSELRWNPSHEIVEVRIEVFEGPQVLVDRVLLRGLELTREPVLRRLLGPVEGQPMGIRRRLELQRRLYRLGVFSRVSIELAPGTPYDVRRDLIVRVEEGANRRFAYGVGYDSEQGIRGLLGLGHANLLGRALSVQGEAQGNDVEYQTRLLGRVPTLAGHEIPLTVSLFRIQERHEEFVSKRRGGQVQLERLSEHWRASLLYGYRVVEVETDAIFDPLDVDRELLEVEVASLTPGLLLDFRDNPIDPRRGWAANVQVERAFPLFAAEEEFVKTFGQISAYLPLGRLGGLAGSLRLGRIDPRAGLGRDPILEPADPEAAPHPASGVPMAERFFAGGRTSHRAFPRDGLGVPGQTLLEIERPDGRAGLVAVGGDALAIANLDYRFPIAGALEGVVFVDHGNVWQDWDSIDWSEARTGAGVGVRYASPIGPLRLEIGWKLDRRDGSDGLPAEDPYEVSFSFGNPF